MDKLTAIEEIIDEYKDLDHRVHVCCCGDYMAGHSDPMYCGHSPVDSGEYHAGLMVEAAREELRQMRELLKRAGNALDIHSSQKVRSLRFQILDFLGRPDDGKV